MSLTYQFISFQLWSKDDDDVQDVHDEDTDWNRGGGDASASQGRSLNDLIN